MAVSADKSALLTLHTAPEIITTAPTIDLGSMQPKKAPFRMRIGRARRSADALRNGVEASAGSASKDKRGLPVAEEEPFTAHPALSEQSLPATSPPQVDSAENDVSLGPQPNNRPSDSSKSDAGGADHSQPPASASRPVPATTGFLRLRTRRRKQAQLDSLFPLSHLPQKGNPSVSQSSLVAQGADHGAGEGSQLHFPQTLRTSRPGSGQDNTSASALPSPSNGAHGRASMSPAAAIFRPGSRNSGHSSPAHGPRHQLRGRSSTMSSVGHESVDDHLVPPTTRTSTSTGRKSFGDLFNLGRLARPSDLQHGKHGSLTPATPGSNTSKNNSLQLPREPSILLPERREDESPAKYLARLEETLNRSVIASALSKSADPFFEAVLRSYMRTFAFFGDPMDMAIRKLLMEAELPKETQQIDRCLQALANRYHECNPGIYSSPEQAYFIAFSLLILHTDVFNKNNKHKMQKADYLKNTRGEGVADEILECFFDNITYTPFIRVEDDVDVNGDRFASIRSRRKFPFQNGTADSIRKTPKEPLDPYALILESKLDILRPNLKDVMDLEDHYSYLGTAKSLNLKELQKTFFRTGILQIVSARSRPDAFMTEKTSQNPDEAHPGIVDIKITKVGLLWRKDAKKKKTRSPWQEWGAILTGAHLYFFRNTAWIKSLMHQYETHIRQGHDGIPVIFKPPLPEFKPDALMSTEDAVALVDSSYKRHKNAFLYVRHGGFEEVLLADNEDEMNDWLAKLNYAAAFRTSGVRMRGVVGGNYEGQVRRGIRRLDSSDATQTLQTPTGEVTIARGRIDFKEARDIFMARREAMRRKIEDAAERLRETQAELDTQLRNARHIQILAPIQPKTREQILLGAGRMSAQVKWTLMETWKLKCHRDILMQDLEEEKQSGAWAAWDAWESNPVSPVEKVGPSNTEAKASPSASQPGPRSPTPLSSRAKAGPSTADAEPTSSPIDEVFQTPPTSATSPTFFQHHPSWELPPLTFDSSDLRRQSVSSATSSGPEVPCTPPRQTMSAASERKSASIRGQSDDVDAAERALIEKAGLITPKPLPEISAPRPDAAGTPERRRRASAGATDKQDRSRIRRSLQRTLREGAGHLSHNRSRKGRESVSTAGTADEAAREEVLSRGTGSFVVHGKKASVINFGSELQNISPDSRMSRVRKPSHLSDLQPQSLLDKTIAPGNAVAVVSDDEDNGEETNNGGGPNTESAEPGPYSSRLGIGGRERRESATSASTATARSFRELHRKYSWAKAGGSRAGSRAGSRGIGGAATPAIPSDDDDERVVDSNDEADGQGSAPVHISNGRRRAQKQRRDTESSDDEDGDNAVTADEEPNEMGKPVLSRDAAPGPAAEGRHETHVQSGRPSSSSSSNSRISNGSSASSSADEAADRLPSPPPVQAVSA